MTATEGIIERSADPAVHDRAVLHVRTPTLKVFHPARPNGAAVLICPGGGYQRVVLDKEGDELA
ncbi:MAG TPA: alpha/beta hydrolase, partial [Hyphomonadaceae bacterium]|nr:alpha/beta hydrolase [Hyphomonadaceae bacterium]